MEIFILMTIVCAVLGYAIANEGEKAVGLFLGLFLGVFGVIIVALMRNKGQ